MSVKVLDVSYWQGTINFSSVKKAGYNHVIIRAGYGTTTDPNFYTYAKSCALNGIKIGVYWFCYSTTIAEVKKEATKCIETIKNYNIENIVINSMYSIDGGITNTNENYFTIMNNNLELFKKELYK